METQNHEFIIIGAGPAGLQLAYYLGQSKQDYLVLDGADAVGSFFTKYPRRRQLISFNKVHSLYKHPEINLRFDWNSLMTDDYSFNFSDYSKELYPSADDLVAYLKGFQEHFNLNVQLNSKVITINKLPQGLFEIDCANDTHFTCKSLVVATGFSRLNRPKIKGIEHVTETYGNVSLDPNDFTGQAVLIIGKGNSSFEIADNLLSTTKVIHLASSETLRLAWNTRFAGHLRADYARIMDTYQLKLLNGSLDCFVESIETEGDKFVVCVRYVHAGGETEELVYDRVIDCTGFSFDKSIFTENCRPNVTECGRLPECTPGWESTNVGNLFFAGTLMQYLDRQVTASAFIDGFRYNCRTLVRLMRERFLDHNIQSAEVSLNLDDVYNHLIERICTTSGLWAQFGFLCDVMAVEPAENKVVFYEEFGTDYALERFKDHSNYCLITFEWGPWSGDVFAIERQPKAETAYTNAFLHPILRRYEHGQCVETHHMLEDLFGMYRIEGESGIVRSRSGMKIDTYHREEHELPLKDFLARHLQLSPASKANLNL